MATARDPPDFSNETTHAQPQPVHLKFPTIDLNTSLESLLSHSTPTASKASAIMATAAPPPPALDESWASLDVSDLSHDDDDSQSVNTDTGSLVDLSSAHDTESAVEDESQSELDAGEERVANMLNRGVSRYSEQVGQPDQQDFSTSETAEDTIILQQAAVQQTPWAIDMEYVRDRALTSDTQIQQRETITMTISANDLEPFNEPVRICYYGSQYSSNTKDELLGKIGAALVVPLSNSSSRTSTSSTCFSIVPTEFGPGSKPAFADLIPSQTQMAVDELSVVLNPLDQNDTIHFALRRGVVVDSTLTSLPEETDCKEFRPDLLVIHLSDKDVKDGFQQLNGLLSLATRHCWPTIIVADDDTITPNVCHLLPNGYGIEITTEIDSPNDDVCGIVRPVDSDTFMALDTVQLSRHIMHLMETRVVEEHHNNMIKPLPNSLVSKVRHSITGATPRRYVLKVIDPKADPPSSHSNKQSWFDEMKRAWSTMEGRKYVKDLLFTLIVMMLGVYIVSFSQNLSSKVNGLVGHDNATSVSSKTDITATVTATSAITISTTTATAASNQDVALYDPVSFDQMWHRLTGRAIPEQEKEKLPQDVEDENLVETQSMATENVRVLDSTLHRFSKWLHRRFTAFKVRAEQRAVAKYTESLEKCKKRVEVRDLHKKLQDFYKDVTANVPKMSLSSQEHLHDLVARSQHHLKQTRWAGEKKLERLIADQKSLLSQAQYQARHIVSAKKKTRTSFFKRG